MAVEHDEENTIRTNPRIYTTRPSANESDHGTRSNDMITTNKRPQDSHTGSVTESTRSHDQRNEISTLQGRRKSLARRDTSETPL
jgi:hypothetical protein